MLEKDIPEKLRALIKAEGQSILDDPAKFHALLLDYCIGIRNREINALTTAVQQRVPLQLLSSDNNTATNEILNSLTYLLIENTGLSDTSAEWAVNTLAFALGKTNEPVQLDRSNLDKSILISITKSTHETNKAQNNRQRLDSIINAQVFSEDKLIDFLIKEYPDLYGSSIGVWEGYTLKEHTLMVLRQFEKYFSHRPLPGNIDKGVFRLTLALHDIGVPMAIQTGDKTMEFRYSMEVVEDFLTKYNFPVRDIDLATALVSVDPIGPYIKVSADDKTENNHKYWISKESYDIVMGMAAKCQMDVNTYFELLLIFYMVDAGSYTVDAGGKPGLDRLFIFEPKIRLMRFSPAVQNAIDRFKRFLNPVPGCLWIDDHNWHDIEYKHLKAWVKQPEKKRILDNRGTVPGVTFIYRKDHGKYQVQLKTAYVVAFYDPDN